MAAINDYRDLEVWQIGRKLAKAIYEVTAAWAHLGVVGRGRE